MAGLMDMLKARAAQYGNQGTQQRVRAAEQAAGVGRPAPTLVAAPAAKPKFESTDSLLAQLRAIAQAQRSSQAQGR